MKILSSLFFAFFVIFIIILSSFVLLISNNQNSLMLSDDISIVTYNVQQYYYPDRKENPNSDEILEFLSNKSFDIIALQEIEGEYTKGSDIDGVNWIAQKMNFYHYYNKESNSSQMLGVSLLSRWPIKNIKSIKLPSIDKGRPLIIVDIESPYGTLPIAVTHLVPYGYHEKRLEQINIILKIMADYKRCILLGDFNTPPSDNGYGILNISFIDGWISGGNKLEGGKTYPTYEPKYRLDYIWTKGNINITKNTIEVTGNKEISDHFAVKAKITFLNTPIS